MYFNFIILLSVVSVYLIVKVPKINGLLQNEKNFLFDRWSVNFSYEAVNQIISFIFLQAMATELSHWLTPHTQFLNMRSVATVVLAVFCLDFIFYWRHRFYHKFLMIVHRTHHRDESFDLTLSFRIHPIEMIVQMMVFMAVIYIFKLDRWQTMTVSLIFTLQAFYSHLELRLLPQKATQWLSKIFIMPEFHFSHHQKNSECNYGFLFSIWDRFFGTAVEINQKNTFLQIKEVST